MLIFCREIFTSVFILAYNLFSCVFCLALVILSSWNKFYRRINERILYLSFLESDLVIESVIILSTPKF